MVTVTGPLTDSLWHASAGPRTLWERSGLQAWLVPAPFGENILAQLHLFLSSEERERAARFRQPQDRANFITTRACLRQLLARYLKCSAAELVFQNNAHGKPELCGRLAEKIHFNVSHSGDHCLLAFAEKGAVGVDIEHWREHVEYDEIAKRFFTDEEFSWIMSVPEKAQQSERFYACWTLKEAYLKATGTGLSGSLKSLSVLPALRNPQQVFPTSAGWNLLTLSSGLKDYSAGICWADGAVKSPQMFHWSVTL